MISYAVNLMGVRDSLPKRGNLRVATDISDLKRLLEGVPYPDAAAGGAGGKPPFGTTRPLSNAGESPRPGGGPSDRVASMSVDVKAIPPLEREMPASKGGASPSTGEIPPAKGEVPPSKSGMPPKGEPPQSKSEVPPSKGGGPPRNDGGPPHDGSGLPSGGGPPSKASQPPSGGSPQQSPGVRLAIAKDPKLKESALVFDNPKDFEALQSIQPSWPSAKVNIRIRSPHEVSFPFAPEMEGRFVHVVDVSFSEVAAGRTIKSRLLNALAGFKSALAPGVVERLGVGVRKIFKESLDTDMIRAMERYKAMMKEEGAEKIKVRVKHEKDIVFGEPAARVRRGARG
jgi:hypothetical protein